MDIPNFESICPTEIFEFPPAFTWGLILTQTAVLGFRLPNCSNIDKLSIFIWTPYFETASISSIETPFGVYIILLESKPANKPSSTSWIETVSSQDPSFFMNFKIEIFDKALTA